MNPLVSVIIPVYNAEKQLPGCVESVFAQTWKNLEIIIVNDGSTDASLRVAQSYCNDKVRVINQKNSGASIARNTALQFAKGDYIQFLDADDLLSPEKIEGQINILDHTTNRLALCRTEYFYNGEEEKKSSPRESWYYKDHDDPVDFLLKLYAIGDVMPGYGGMIQPNAWLTPRELIEKAGLWSELRSPDDDGEFFCRVILASEGIKFSNVGVNYYRRYRYNESLSGQQSLQSFVSHLATTDLKYQHLKQRTDNPIVDRIFAMHYLRIGVVAYPKYKSLSKETIQKAELLGYTGKKYLGGPAGKKFANLFGWKAARYVVHYLLALKKVEAVK